MRLLRLVTPFLLSLLVLACGDDAKKATDAEVHDVPTDVAETEVATETVDTAVDTLEDPIEDATPDVALDTEDSGPDAAPETVADSSADTSDTSDGDSEAVDWSDTFDVPAALVGARSDIPDEIMSKWPALLGGRMTRHSAITGIEFHIPGVISSKGMSPVPIPIRKHINGVEYWQISGEISSRNQDDWSVYYAIGPIDEKGVNHRAEPYDPFEPTEADPDESASHPRAGLPGAIFMLRWPVAGFNGGIVQMQAAGDAGNGTPQALMAWWPVDPLTLLERGYAVASVAAGGTVYARKEADGAWTVDTNPESGSDIFFNVDFDLQPWNNIYESEHSKLVSTLRAIQVDPTTFAESAWPAVTEVELVFPFFNEETGEWDQDRFVDNITRPDVNFPIAFYGMELMTDTLVVYKNLLRQATGATAIWAAYLGWSGSGTSAWSLNTGTQSSGAFQFEKSLGMPPSGGNFNTWHDPSSGVRFDAFLVYGSARAAPAWQDSAGFAEISGRAHVDPDYPLSAPIVYVRGEADVINGDYGEKFWTNSTIMANSVARAWPTSKMKDASLDDYLAIYELATLTHQVRDQLFTAWDRAPFDVHALWYDPTLGYAPESINAAGRGLRLSEVYARQNVAFEQDNIEDYAGTLYQTPRITPIMVSLIESLRAATEEGAKLPVSRVGPLLADIAAVDETTLFPPYPAPCEFTDESPWEDFLACRDGITEDSSWAQSPLLDFELAAVHEFISDNPLSRIPERLAVPDVAAPLGWYFINYGATQLRRDFDHAELVARYGDHAGYVAAFTAATQTLIDAGLWDAALGQLYIDAAEASDVLADE